MDGPWPLKLKIAQAQPQTTMKEPVESRSEALMKEQGLYLSSPLLCTDLLRLPPQGVFFPDFH